MKTCWCLWRLDEEARSLQTDTDLHCRWTKLSWHRTRHSRFRFSERGLEPGDNVCVHASGH